MIGIAPHGVSCVSPILAFDGVVGERLGDEVGQCIAFVKPAGDVESATPRVLVVARCVGEVRRPRVEPRTQPDDDGVGKPEVRGCQQFGSLFSGRVGETRAMQVEVLYVDGCPHWREAAGRVEDAAAALNVGIDLRFRLISSEVEAASFAGSPTILVDGRDAFEGAAGVNDLACRVYLTDSGLAGVPTVEQLAFVLTERSHR